MWVIIWNQVVSCKELRTGNRYWTSSTRWVSRIWSGRTECQSAPTILEPSRGQRLPQLIILMLTHSTIYASIAWMDQISKKMLRKDLLKSKMFSRILRHSSSNLRASALATINSLVFRRKKRTKSRWVSWRTSSYKLSTKVKVKYWSTSKPTSRSGREGRLVRPS